MKSPLKSQYTSMKGSKSIISKSSRISKQHIEQQQKQPILLYFQQDPIRTQLMNRISYVSPKLKTSKSPDHLQKAENIISDLMNRHKKAKQKLQRMKEESEKCYEKIHTFAPKIQSNKQRYTIKGDVVRRNEIWLRQKKKHTLELKQQITIEDLKQCTFTPHLRSKKKSQTYLRHRQASRSVRSGTPKSRTALNQMPVNHDQSPKFIQNNRNHFTNKQRYQTHNITPPKSRKRDYTEVEYESAKQNLISRMMNISY